MQRGRLFLINWFGIFYLKLKKHICISLGNKTINSLYQNDFIHRNKAGLPGWEFDHLTGSGVDGYWDPSITSLHENIPYGGLFYFQYRALLPKFYVSDILLSVVLISFISLLKWSVFSRGKFVFRKNNCFCACKWNLSSDVDLSYVCRQVLYNTPPHKIDSKRTVTFQTAR